MIPQSRPRPGLFGRLFEAAANPYVHCGLIIGLYFALVLIVPALTRMHLDAVARQEAAVATAMRDAERGTAP